MRIENTQFRKTYPQNWKAYNAAQTSEKAQFLKFLHSLCSTIEEPQRQTKGRPRYPLNDIVFAICYKIFSTVSCRRFMSDLQEAQMKGYIEKTPHFNSLFNYLENPALTPILEGLIIKTSLPLSAVETDFAADSSGFTASQLNYWRQHKYGKKQEHAWVKVHIVCGVKTNIVTAASIMDKYTNDTVPFADMVDQTAQNFKIGEVSGDKAYASGYNFRVVEQRGGLPFIAFKKNNKPGVINDIWQKMFYYFKLNEAEYMQHYHKRSNVETTFSMMKAKFGGYVRSKTETAMKNEALCKIICHNICVLIQEMHELGIEIDFSAQKIGAF
jgi:transposase